MNYKCLLILLICISNLTFAAAPTTKKRIPPKTDYVIIHTSYWIKAVITGPASSTNKKIKYYAEPELRLIDDRYLLDEAHMYLGLGYQFNKNLADYIGIAPVVSENLKGVSIHEARFWQQMDWKICDSKSINISTRSRLEERKDVSEASRMAFRAREKISVTIPIYNLKTYDLAFSNESFFNINHPKWVSNKFYAENRAFIGIEKHISKKTYIDLGYLNQFLFRQQPERMNNAISLAFNVDLD